jgi:hypothetical protein
MYQSSRLRHALYGVRPLLLQGSKVLQDAAPQGKASTGISVDKARTSPEQDERALQRLLSRTEFELSDTDAVRRRETIACLKLAAASTKA